MTVYVNSELKQQIVDFAHRYGCSMTGMASMAIFTGIKTIQRNLEQEEFERN
jgi:hypothetical protein